MATPNRTALAFRGDIEGLRAIAILLVVAAHAKVPWLQGGFVGVDVFFVLSGYLITSLLVREIGATGTVNLLGFYARRLRRLLPALLLVIACTISAAILLLAPFEQTGQAEAAAAASVWVSNFHFAFSKLDYFGPAAETNLFLHTWSLGVEEQFYLVWPLLVLFLLGALRWQTPDAHQPKRLLGGMLALALACLLLCLFLTYTQPAWAFYMMPARAWQFALGAIASLKFPNATRHDSPSAGYARLAGWLGLAMILAAALWLTPQTPYPGLAALLPSLGAAGVLVSGAAAPQAGPGRWIALAPLQAIGRVSYSWYLWHWPVLLLGAAWLGQTRPWQTALFVLLSLLLAAATYRWFETPIRRSAALAPRPLLNVAAGLLLMVGMWAICQQHWLPASMRWAQQPQQLALSKARGDAPVIYGMGCDEWYQSARLRLCAFGPSDAPHTAVIVGDSVALQWFPAFAKMFDRPGWRLLVLTKSACPMVDAPFFYERIGRRYTECETWRQGVLEALPTLHPDVVVLGSSQFYPFSAEQWIDGSRRVFTTLDQATQGAVYVLQATPVLPFDVPTCLARENWRPGWLQRRSSCDAVIDTSIDRQVAEWLGQAASGLPKVKLVDPNPAVCPNQRCPAVHDGQVAFRDGRHISASHASQLQAELARAIVLPPD